MSRKTDLNFSCQKSTLDRKKFEHPKIQSGIALSLFLDEASAKTRNERSRQDASIDVKNVEKGRKLAELAKAKI